MSTPGQLPASGDGLLLDECIDRPLAREPPGHRVCTVPQMGWATTKNGLLLRLAEAEFDVFIAVDRNLWFLQDLPKFEIAVVVLRAKSYRLEDLKPLVPKLPTRCPRTYAWQPGSGEMAIVAGRGPGFR